MLIVTRRRGPERCRFGDDVRGLDIDNLELHPEDLMVMLEMDENELKTNIHKILCSMKNSADYRRYREHPSSDDYRYRLRKRTRNERYDWNDAEDSHKVIPTLGSLSAEDQKKAYENILRGCTADSTAFTSNAWDKVLGNENMALIEDSISKLSESSKSGLVWTEEE